MKMCRNRDSMNSGFDLLIKTYQQRIYWQVRKMVIDHNDADDLVQEIFIKIWKYLPTFREESKLSTWIYRITVNEVLSFLSKKKKMNFISLTGQEHQFADQLKGDQNFTGDQVQEKFQCALQTLPAKQRLVFQLKYFDELKYEEMSEILETSVGALKASYHHAVKKIQKYIINH